MALLKNSKQPAKPQRLDWREHQSYRAAQQAHHEHKARLLKMRDDLHPDMALHEAVRQAEKASARAERDFLAGRIPEAEVAVAHNRVIETKRALAIAEIELEEAEAHEKKLAANIGKQRKIAKQTAADSLRARYKEALVEIKAAMERAIAADQVLHDVLRDLDAQFKGDGVSIYAHEDEDGYIRALNLPHVFHGGENIPTLLQQIDEAIAKVGIEG